MVRDTALPGSAGPPGPDGRSSHSSQRARGMGHPGVVTTTGAESGPPA